MDLAEKVAVITGAAKGIGAAAADLISEKGAAVIIADIQLEKAQEFAEKLLSKGRRAYAVHVDISKEESVEHLISTAVHVFGKLDILVNNAGIISTSPISDLSIEDWDQVIDVNLRGTFLCSKAAVTEMIKNRQGKIINIASMAGQIGGLKVSPDYTASKAGIIGIAKSFARYGAPYGINVNAVAPGFIETEMTKGRDDPSSVPLGRLGTPEDVAKVVYFLASSMSDYITGATIDVNGGLLMR
jgi:3-oxoacyl-[acyl-carrier protein] reductase